MEQGLRGEGNEEEEAIPEREYRFRLAKRQCNVCQGQFFLMACVYQQYQGWKLWCPNCIARAYSKFTSMRFTDIDTWDCANCGELTHFSYVIFWMGRQQIWCPQCTEEALAIQVKKVNADL